MTIISCTGYGNSGSSAATNFCEEFSTVSGLDHEFECTFIHETDGLMDLFHAVKEGHRLKVDAAVHRFLNLCKKLDSGRKSDYKKAFDGKFYSLSYSFIQRTFICQWKGFWNRSLEFSPLTIKEKRRFDLAEKKYHQLTKNNHYSLYEQDSWRPSYMPYRIMYYCSDEFLFIEEAKKYIYELIQIANKKNTEFFLIDQLLPPTAINEYLVFFDNLKCVIVDRDPRDIYISNKVFWGNRFFPSNSPENFIEWFKGTRKNQNSDSSSCFIKLEDFVYDYEKTSQKLINFIGLNEKDHINKFAYMNPNLSIKNTKIWLGFPEFQEHIQKIEKSLSSYLFDYKETEIVYNNSKDKSQSSYIIENAINEADKRIKKINFTDRFFFLFTTIMDFKKMLIISYKNLKKCFSIYNLCKTIFFAALLPFSFIWYFFKGIIYSILL